MKKLVLLLALAALMLMPAGFAAERANVIPPSGMGQFGYQAVVVCESLTVREEANAYSKAVKTLGFGSIFMFTDQSDGWAKVILSDSLDAAPEGWVNMDYAMIDPSWYRTDAKEPVYAWNDIEAPRVALIEKDTLLPVLKDDGEWLVVSIRGAVGWLHINDAD